MENKKKTINFFLSLKITQTIKTYNNAFLAKNAALNALGNVSALSFKNFGTTLIES